MLYLVWLPHGNGQALHRIALEKFCSVVTSCERIYLSRGLHVFNCSQEGVHYYLNGAVVQRR